MIATILFTISAVMLWQIIGWLSVAWIRPDLAGETRDALINTWFWPAGLAIQPVWWWVRRHREKQRQARVTAKVLDGTYTAEWARTNLRWKG